MDLSEFLSVFVENWQIAKAMKEKAGRSEEGRLLAIACTDIEKAVWAIQKAEEIKPDLTQ